VHSDPVYVEDILLLENYILMELNVHSLTVTVDESNYNIHYRVEADAKALGSKLKKDASKVKAELPSNVNFIQIFL
jgi:isoleucyl-tRNA synthetase